MRGNTRRGSGKASTASGPRAWQGPSSPVHPRSNHALRASQSRPSKAAVTPEQFRRAGRAATCVCRKPPPTCPAKPAPSTEASAKAAGRSRTPEQKVRPFGIRAQGAAYPPVAVTCPPKLDLSTVALAKVEERRRQQRRQTRIGQAFSLSPYPVLRRTRRASFRKRWRKRTP